MRTRTAAVLMTAALLTTACGARGYGSVGALRAEPSPSAASSSAAAVTVPDALKFTARTLDGKVFKGESLAGKYVVFWFWAPWCVDCHDEAPAVRAASAKFHDVAFIGVAGLDTEAAMKEFVQRTKTGTIVQLSDDKGVVWTKLGVSEQSTYVFMRPNGWNRRTLGPLTTEELTGYVTKLLAG
ncbi:TlpA family protein disulfide reductase [Streptosporangium sp. CA-135522]|uniref:TlpA family protein disulfide reductase n=1 Tax=Streptosporangium sp. CA-135522 TaxID=3240072 RepID=UPI003D938906